MGKKKHRGFLPDPLSLPEGSLVVTSVLKRGLSEQEQCRTVKER